MAYKFNALNVLVVESSHAMFELTKSVLNTFGIDNVSFAYDVESGFREYCRQIPDLVVMDWLDDEETGLLLAERIRQDQQSPNPFVPIIMMTGFSQKKRVIAARDSGITEFVVKPYTAATLYSRIERIIEQPRQFVKSPDFFGPDRRRQTGNFSGPDKRRNREEQVKSHSIAARVAKDLLHKNETDGEFNDKEE